LKDEIALTERTEQRIVFIILWVLCGLCERKKTMILTELKENRDKIL